MGIRESIEKDYERRKAAEEAGESLDETEDFDDVPEITKSHFEMALSEARRSVSDADLLKYGSFAQNLQQQRGQMLGGATSFQFGNTGNGGNGGGNAPNDDDDDDDLYS